MITLPSPKYFVASLAFAMIVLLAGCKPKGNSETATSEDIAVAEALFADLFKTVDKYTWITQVREFNQAPILDPAIPVCFTHTIDPPLDSVERWPKTLTIDFGSGCDEFDGKERRGRLIIELTTWFGLETSQATVTFDNYFVDNNRYDGVYAVTNNDNIQAGRQSYNELIDGKLFTADGDFIVWQVNRFRDQLVGEDTPEFQGDDRYRLTGTTSGINRNGIAFDATMGIPAIDFVTCRWVPLATYEVRPEGLDPRTLDFGQGDCDPDATVFINGKTFHFTMD